MKFSVKTAGFTLLGAAYIVSSFLVFRHVSKDEEPGRVTIRIAQWQLESGVREAVNAIIHRYEQINPHVHVVQIAVPGNATYMSWTLTQMAGGTAPDLMEYAWTGSDIGRHFQALDAEVMQPNPYNRGTPLEGVPWRDTFVDGMTGLDNFNPQLHAYYGISMNTNASRIVYNRPLLKAITGSDAPPSNYRAFLALGDQVRAYAEAHKLNLVSLANSRDTYAYFGWMIGMDMTDRLSERIDFQHRLKVEPTDVGLSFLRRDWSYDTPEMVATLQELKEYGAMCTPGFWQRERDTAVTDFVTGHAVMIVAPSWEATNLLALSDFGIGVFTYPYPDEHDPVYGRYTKGPFSDGPLLPGMPIYLNRETKHRAEAIDFLRFMSSQEGSTIFTNVSNWPPATKGVKPSDFAAKFSYDPEGYCWFGNFLIPTEDINTQWFIQTRFASLWNTNGSVDAFRSVMREEVGDSIREDFTHDLSYGLDNLRLEDTAAVARAELTPPGHRPEVLRLTAINNELKVYQTRAVLAGAVSAEPRSAPGGIAESASPDPTPAPAGTARVSADPELVPGWQALASYHAEQALPVFDRKLNASDPAVAREAHFGHALAALNKQPVSAGQIEEARRGFAELADGSDDVAQGARFFLGRIAQNHQQTPDPLEADRQYRQLIAGHPDSMWAQTALSRLAILEIYALDPSSPPEVRIARADKLVALARTPSAACELHLVIANAIFFYRLPDGPTLAHLLAAVRSDRLDRATRTEVLVQVAELSRLAGDKAQAARYYQLFLDENPIDFRCYIVRERLAAVEKS